MSFLDSLATILAPLPRIATTLEVIATQLTRLADAHEGITPPLRVVPEAPPEPASIAPADSDRDFAKIEAIEQRWLVMGGRLPTSDEVCRELDGEVVPDSVLQAEFQRLRRVPEDHNGA